MTYYFLMNNNDVKKKMNSFNLQFLIFLKKLKFHNVFWHQYEVSQRLNNNESSSNSTI